MFHYMGFSRFLTVYRKRGKNTEKTVAICPRYISELTGVSGIIQKINCFLRFRKLLFVAVVDLVKFYILYIPIILEHNTLCSSEQSAEYQPKSHLLFCSSTQCPPVDGSCLAQSQESTISSNTQPKIQEKQTSPHYCFIIFPSTLSQFHLILNRKQSDLDHY